MALKCAPCHTTALLNAIEEFGVGGVDVIAPSTESSVGKICKHGDVQSAKIKVRAFVGMLTAGAIRLLQSAHGRFWSRFRNDRRADVIGGICDG